MANTQLYKIRLNNQGYDDRGHYYGVGPTLWRFVFDDGQTIIDGELRAYSRERAKLLATARIVEHYRFDRKTMDVAFYR